MTLWQTSRHVLSPLGIANTALQDLHAATTAVVAVVAVVVVAVAPIAVDGHRSRARRRRSGSTEKSSH